MNRLRSKIGPVPSYCEALCLQEGNAAEVKMGAQAVLEHLQQCADTANLLRPGQGESGREKETLLRALS